MIRNRLQKGSITLRSGRWFTRYRTGTDRRMVSEFLHEKDHVHHSANCPAVKRLNQEVMVRVNSEKEQVGASLSVARFVEYTFMPWVRANKKASTQRSYRQGWSRLEAHFGETTLSEYKTSDASRFLSSLAEKGQGRHFLAATRSLVSSIFSLAVNLGQLDRNPLSEAKVLSKVKPPPKAKKYSLREVQVLASSLREAGRPDLELCAMLMGFLGLRPSECSALAWDCVDLEKGEIFIKRAVVHGVVGSVKTEESEASLPLLSFMVPLFRQLPRIEGTGWCFPNERLKPIDLSEAARKVARPAVDRRNASHEEKIVWKGWYALRRSAASTLWKMTGRTEASTLLLRHSNPLTVNRHYLVADRSAMEDALRTLEQELEK
jgi:integrase